LLVADLAGQLTLLDPNTGATHGEQTLPAGVAPAAAPAAWSAGRVFAPLTDGTILLLKLD
jgi:hypothetical protein